MPKGGSKDQLTGGTKDVNPHYRHLVISRSLDPLPIQIAPSSSSGQVSLVDLLTIDTGIAQNVPAGRGGKQIVMELLSVDLQAQSTLSEYQVTSGNLMDSLACTGSTAFNGSHWAKMTHSEAVIIASSPLPVGGAIGALNSSLNANGPTVVMTEVDKVVVDYGYVSGTVATSAMVPYQRRYNDRIDLTDQAGHGLLIATQKLYIYATSVFRLDWENSSAGGGVFAVEPYAWDIDLQYRWKEVPEAEYLQILIENTSVN